MVTDHGSRPFPDKSARLIHRFCFVLAKTPFQSVQKSCPDRLFLRRIEIAALARSGFAMQSFEAKIKRASAEAP